MRAVVVNSARTVTGDLVDRTLKPKGVSVLDGVSSSAAPEQVSAKKLKKTNSMMRRRVTTVVKQFSLPGLFSKAKHDEGSLRDGSGSPSPRLQDIHRKFQKDTYNPRRPSNIEVDPKLITTNLPTINPSAKWKLIWDLFIGILIFYSVVIIPYRIGFDVEASSGAQAFDGVIDTLFGIDLIMCFFVAYSHPDIDDVLITNKQKIGTRYLLSWFIVDFASTFPFDVVATTAMGDNAEGNENFLRSFKIIRFLRLMRLLKLVRMIKMSKLMRNLQENFTINPAALSLVNLLLKVVFISHILCCFWYFLGSANASEASPSWVKAENLQGAEVSRKYLTSLYWTVASITAVGYGDVHATTQGEMYYSIFTQLIGSSVFGFIIGNISNLVEKLDLRMAKYKKKYNEVKFYLNERKFPRELKFRVLAYFRVLLTKRSLFDEQFILSNLSATLREEVILQGNSDVIKMISFFNGSDSPKGFITSIVLKLKPQYELANEKIMQPGEPATEMLFIVEGCVEKCTFRPLLRKLTGRKFQTLLLDATQMVHILEKLR